MSHGRGHAPDLTVPAFLQNQFDPAIGNGLAYTDWWVTRPQFGRFVNPPRLRRAGAPVLQADAGTQGFKGLVARQAFDTLAPGGRAIVAGLTTFDQEIRLPAVSLLLDKTLRGSIYGSTDPSRDFPKLFALCSRGELEIEAMAGGTGTTTAAS